MSWYIEVTGTKAGVARIVAAEFDKQIKTYETYEGKEEGKDLVACKERALALIDAMVIEDFANAIAFKANGSHSGGNLGLFSAQFTVSVTRVHLALD